MQEIFVQSLIEIGLLVLEKKSFFKDFFFQKSTHVKILSKLWPLPTPVDNYFKTHESSLRHEAFT
jgi:hypothetical protein